jgi:hypothetical protein
MILGVDLHRRCGGEEGGHRLGIGIHGTIHEPRQWRNIWNLQIDSPMVGMFNLVSMNRLRSRIGRKYDPIILLGI